MQRTCGTFTNTESSDSRKTCGKRSPKRWPSPGGRPKQCTGKSAKSKWRNAPTSPCSTLPARTTHPHLPAWSQSQTAGPAPRQAPSLAVPRSVTLTRTRIRTTTAYPKSPIPCRPPSRPSRSAWRAGTAAAARLARARRSDTARTALAAARRAQYTHHALHPRCHRWAKSQRRSRDVRCRRSSLQLKLRGDSNPGANEQGSTTHRSKRCTDRS